MSKLKYVMVIRRKREDILSALESGDVQKIRDALISAAYWEDDWRWAQYQLLRFVDHESDLVKWAVATGLGFIAVFNGEIDESLVLPVLAKLRKSRDEFVAGSAEESEWEIKRYVRERRRGKKVTLARRLPENWRPPQGYFSE